MLIGLGASAISKFPQGFAQNASGTADYQKAIRAGNLATGRGHLFKGEDRLRARLIEALMCDFRIDSDEIRDGFGISDQKLEGLYREAEQAFPAMVSWNAQGFTVRPEGRALARLIARAFDEYEMREEGHSSAI